MTPMEYVRRFASSGDSVPLILPLVKAFGLAEAAMLSVLLAAEREDGGWTSSPMMALQEALGIGQLCRERVMERLRSRGLVEVRRSRGERLAHPAEMRLDHCRIAGAIRSALTGRITGSRNSTAISLRDMVIPKQTETPTKATDARDPHADPDADPHVNLDPSTQLTPALRKAFSRWMAWREVHRYPTSDRVRRQHLKALSHLTEEDALATIKESMDRGWQGLFPPRKTPQQVNDLALDGWRRAMAMRSRRWYRMKDRSGEGRWLSAHTRPHNAWSSLDSLKRDMAKFSLRQPKARIPDDLAAPAWRPPNGWAWRKFIDWHVRTVDPQHRKIYTGE